jgi:hypothetical protein
MRTQAQIEAARRNGAKSRGPVTAEGKARSSRNAVRHGLCSQTPATIAALDPAGWSETLDEAVRDFRPVTREEHDLVAEIAAARWRIARAVRVESAAGGAALTPFAALGVATELRTTSFKPPSPPSPPPTVMKLPSTAPTREPSRPCSLSRTQHRRFSRTNPTCELRKSPSDQQNVRVADAGPDSPNPSGNLSSHPRPAQTSKRRKLETCQNGHVPPQQTRATVFLPAGHVNRNGAE